MNKENLLRMAEYIATVSQGRFDMEKFRDDFNYESYECKFAGCVIGHCTILDKYEDIPKFEDGAINFVLWSERFTGISPFSSAWDWCFSWEWATSDNTSIGASKRIKWLVENGLPKNLMEQMSGKAKLCYND